MKIDDDKNKRIYNEIESSKKLIFVFKSKFLNNNNLQIISIKKYILFNLIDSLEQTLKNIQENIIKIQQEKNNIIEINNNIFNKNFKSDDIFKINNGSINYNSQMTDINYDNSQKNYYSHNLNENKNNQNLNIINFLNNNKKFRKEFIPNQINYINNNINNYDYKTNTKKISINNRKKPGIIIKKINSFNSQTIKTLNQNNNEISKNTVRENEQNRINTQNNNNYIINDYNFPYVNNDISDEKNSIISDIKSNNTSDKNNIQNKNYNNNKYYKIEQNVEESNIKIKSPIREVIKKLVKNKNQINESFTNYCNMTNGLHNKSFDFNRSNYSNTNTHTIIEKIQNSENLKKYFAKKYGNGNFITFLNNYKLNKINYELIEKDLDTLEKIKEKDNNINNIIHNKTQIDNKNNLDKSFGYIKKINLDKTPNKSIKIKNNIKNRTIDQMDTKQKQYRTGTPSNRGVKKIKKKKNYFIINKNTKNENFRCHQNTSSFGTNYIQTDNKLKNMIPQSSFIKNKHKYNTKNNIYKRHKTPVNDTNSLRSYSFL